MEVSSVLIDSPVPLWFGNDFLLVPASEDSEEGILPLSTSTERERPPPYPVELLPPRLRNHLISPVPIEAISTVAGQQEEQTPVLPVPIIGTVVRRNDPYTFGNALYFLCPSIAPAVSLQFIQYSGLPVAFVSVSREPELKLGGVFAELDESTLSNLIFLITGISVERVTNFPARLARSVVWVQTQGQAQHIIDQMHQRLWMGPSAALFAFDDEGSKFIYTYLKELKNVGPRSAHFPRHLVTVERWTPRTY